jgi:regulator of protease activity HflC (stomatin/prohibitin superfamily)
MEKRALRLPGFLMLLVLLLLAAAAVVYLADVVDTLPTAEAEAEARIALTAIIGGLLLVVLASGFLIINPNEARVIQFFGRYVGSITRAGFHWTVPLSSKRRLSLRVRNFESSRLKVSDADGNPVEIAAVVVYRVTDSYQAMFAVDDHIQYVAIQAEAAVRHLATGHPYEAHDDSRVSLREGVQVSEELTAELRERVQLAGVEVIESRITHLAYAPEIAQVMLQRQQANAVVAARTRIVDGAVGMVQMALDRLRSEGVIDLDEERKAQMVSNLLVVLCGDRATQPVVNAGTLYG